MPIYTYFYFEVAISSDKLKEAFPSEPWQLVLGFHGTWERKYKLTDFIVATVNSTVGCVVPKFGQEVADRARRLALSNSVLRNISAVK